jgi:hypothetical protein
MITGFLTWSYRNYGRSPAFIIDGTFRVRAINRPLPEPPDYGNREGMLIPIPLPPNKLRRLSTPWLMDPNDYRRIIRNETDFVFYGVIRYRDTFLKREHISRWCAILKLPAFRLAGEPDWFWTFEGPPAYTEYT